MEKDKYQIFLDNFEGPLDLLLHLIEKHKIDIYDIPIAKITKQYLEYIYEAKNLNLDIASEFLVMAAKLLYIKAKMLLPKPEKSVLEEEEEDPRDELVTKLLEYREFKKLAEKLHTNEIKMQKIFFRKLNESELIKQFEIKNPVENIKISDLTNAFEVILKKISSKEPVYELVREEILIQDCMEEIIQKLNISPEGVSFDDLFSEKSSRLRVVVTFLALLELIKLKRVIFMQNNTFGKIIIILKKA